MPERVSGGDAKFQGFCDRWNKWEGQVIGRRLSFGSNSEDGARFTAIVYSVAGTLSMNGIDVLRWLEAWLDACAKNGRQPPDDLSPWLPWSMSEKRRRELMAPG